MNKRLLFSAVLAAAISANEAKATEKVTIPTPTPTQLQCNGKDTVYLYNLKAYKFLSSGGNWKTMAVLKSTGVPFAFVKNDDDPNGGTYNIWDKNGVSGKATWTQIFVDGADADGGVSYCDYNNQTGSWKLNYVVYKGEGNTFQIGGDTLTAHKSEEGAADFFALDEVRWGWKSDADLCTGNGGTVDVMMRPTLQKSDPNFASYGVDWIAVSEKDYTTYQEKYGKKLDLGFAINSAIDGGVELPASVVEVFNNENATDEEIAAAKEDVAIAVRNNAISKATEDAPVDLAAYLSHLTDASTEGWTAEGKFDKNGNPGSGGNGTGWQGKDFKSSPVTDSEGNSLTLFKERWVNSSSENGGKLSDSKLYQTLKRMPKGVYEISGAFSALKQSALGSKNTGTYFFAKGDHMADSVNISNADGNNPLRETLYVSLQEGDSLTFGYETVKTTCNWIYFGDIHVKAIGQSNKALLADLQKVINNTADAMSGVEAYQGYVTGVNEAITKAKAVVSNPNATEEEIVKAKLAIREAYALVEINLDLYTKLADQKQENDEVYTSIPADEADLFDFDDYDDFIDEGNDDYAGYDDITGGHLLNNEQLEAYTKELVDIFDKALKSGIKPGHKVPTVLLADPSFEKGGEGWSGKETVNSTYQNAEAYQKTFDMYQILTGIPNGVYTVHAKAFQRVGNNATAYPMHQNGTEKLTTYLYGNEIEKRVHSVYDFYMTTKSAETTNPDYTPEGETDVYYPNSMQAFKKACEEGQYDNTVNVIVTDGTLRFGIRSKEVASAGWSIWDDFSVDFAGDDYTAVISDIMTEAKELANGVPMCADSLNALNTAITNAEAEATEANANALSAAIKAARNSRDNYETFKAGIDAVAERYDNAPARSDEAKAAYEAVATEVNNGYKNGSVADADIEATVKKLGAAFTQYLVFDDAKVATVKDPKDISYVLSNADFSEDFKGWTKVSGNYAVKQDPGKDTEVDVDEIEFYNQGNFDFNQTISGLPAGRYILTVRGFYRDANNSADLRDSIANNNLNLNVKVYINNSEAELPSQHVGEVKASELEAITGLTSTDGLQVWDESDPEDKTYIPYNMLTAQKFFASEYGPKYDATASYYLPETKDVVIGARKNVAVANDWAIFKEFKLVYAGNGTDGIETVDGKANFLNGGVVGTKIYNVNGVETGALQQGLNIVKTTMSDGTVRVKKIIVK